MKVRVRIHHSQAVRDLEIIKGLANLKDSFLQNTEDRGVREISDQGIRLIQMMSGDLKMRTISIADLLQLDIEDVMEIIHRR